MNQAQDIEPNDILITMDMDWAHDEVIDYSLSLLAEYNIRATLFMTNKVNLDITAHECALHPNFTTLDFEKHITERLEDFPDAKGSRSHSLLYSERLRPVYKKYGIEYQSNVMMYRQHRIRPFMMSPTTIEIPMFWMDNFYIEMEDHRPSFNLEELELHKPGLKIFNFHPIHIFLNTETLQRYEAAKKWYQEPEKIVTLRNKSKGTKDLFIDILEYIRKKQVDSLTLKDIAQREKN